MCYAGSPSQGGCSHQMHVCPTGWESTRPARLLHGPLTEGLNWHWLCRPNTAVQHTILPCTFPTQSVHARTYFQTDVSIPLHSASLCYARLLWLGACRVDAETAAEPMPSRRSAQAGVRACSMNILAPERQARARAGIR